MNSSLFELIQLAQTKDEESMMILINKFDPLIRSLSKKLLYEESKTDVTIEFIKLIYNIKLHTINNTTDPGLISYISIGLKKKSTNLFNKYVKNGPKEIELKLEMIGSEDSSESLVTKVFIHEIFDLDCLSEKQILVLKYKYLHDSSDIEIAKRLNISRQAVNGLKRKALENIRNYLILSN